MNVNTYGKGQMKTRTIEVVIEASDSKGLNKLGNVAVSALERAAERIGNVNGTIRITQNTGRENKNVAMENAVKKAKNASVPDRINDVRGLFC